MYQSQLNQGPFSKWKFRFTSIETTVKNHFDQKVLTALLQIAETLTSLGNDFRVHRSSKIVNSEEFTNKSRELPWNRHASSVSDDDFRFSMTRVISPSKNLLETLGDILNNSNCLSRKHLSLSLSNLVRSYKQNFI